MENQIATSTNVIANVTSDVQVLNIGHIVVSIIQVVMTIVIFIGIIFIINKFVLKRKLKDMWKTAIITWFVMLLINIVFVIIKIPFAIGVPFLDISCGDIKTFEYNNLGYCIIVEKTNKNNLFSFNVDIEEDNTEVYFSTWW